MRRDKNGQFLSSQKINKGGMKVAERERVMDNKQDLSQAAQNDIIRHLVDGDVVEATKKLRVLAAERRLEACNLALESIEETRSYYLGRLARWQSDVDSWPEEKTVKYDGYCCSTSPGMEKLRMEDFEAYKKFIKAGYGVPYYKEYDIAGVEITLLAIRNVDKGINFLKRRIEEYERIADLMARQDNFYPEDYSWDKVKFPEVNIKPDFNVDHWAWVKDFSWRKVNDIKANCSKWSTSLLFETIANVRKKAANKEFTKLYSFWACGLVFEELYNRYNNPSYWNQYQGMRKAYKTYQEHYNTSSKVPEVVPEEDELEANLPVYEVPHYSLTEDEIISYLDR